MSNRQEYLLLGCLDKIDERVRVERLPRHVTLVSWFVMGDCKLDNFIKCLQNFSKITPSPTLIGGSEAYFGPDNDVPVRIVRNRQDFLKLHLDLLAIVDDNGGELNHTDYSGEENYNPHVSKQEDGWIGEDERINLDSFQLAKKLAGTNARREIVANIGFKP